jgi:PST family polysaccharide transporter
VSQNDDHNGAGEDGAPGETPGGLGRQFLVGTMQLGAGHLGVSALNVVVGILLARWLGPEAFGLYAFVFGISEVLAIVGAFSLGAALIQAREETHELYDTAFAICTVLGLVALLLAVALSPWLVEMRGTEAGWFLIALGVGRILRLASQVPRAKLERTIRYDRVTVLSVLETSVPNLIALGLAINGVGPWALVIREVLVAALTLVLQTIFSGYRFRMRVRAAEARQLMNFARPMFVARSVDILLERADRVIVGAMIGNAPAGLLDRGRFLADMGLYVVRPVERASLNLLSRLQDDHARLSRAYGIVNFFLARAMFLGAVVLVLSPAETLRLILGEEWVGAAPALRFLGVHAGIYPLNQMIKVLAIARHEVGRSARISIVQACVLLPSAFFAAWHESLVGVAAAIAFTTCVGAVFGVLWTRDLATIAYRRVLGVPVLLALGTAAVYGAAGALGWLDSLYWAVRPFAVGAVFGVGLLLVEHRELLRELRFLRAQLASGPAAAD